MTVSRVNGRLDREETTRRNREDLARQCKKTSHCSKDNVEIDENVKRYHGDGLVVRMDSNHRALEITGDGCRIILSKNSGSVHVVGDGCRLSVNHNVGKIEYTGDGGRVLLGPNSSEGKVKFVGDDGMVIFNADPEAVPIVERFRLRNPKESSKNQRTPEEPGCTGGTNRCSRGKIVERISRRLRCEKCEGRYEDGATILVSSNQECLDNEINDLKERGQWKRNEETRKSSRRRTVNAKIITKIQAESQCVKKRCGDSPFVVNSTNEQHSLRDKRAGNFARETPKSNDATGISIEHYV